MDFIPIWTGYVHPAYFPRTRVPWVWVRCESPFCGHARAVPYVPWIIRWGVCEQDLCLAMRKHFRCAICGRRCVFQAPLLTLEGIEAFPAGREVRLGLGEAQPGEKRHEATARITKEYLAKHPSGDALGEFHG